MTDDAALDSVQDLSRLSTRQLLERIVRTQNRMELAMSVASEYMTAALSSLDVQMANLQTRLQSDAAALQSAVEQVKAGQADTAALSAAADRVQATAVLVAGLAVPSEVVDEEKPDVEAQPVPETDEPGGSEGGEGGDVVPGQPSENGDTTPVTPIPGEDPGAQPQER